MDNKNLSDISDLKPLGEHPIYGKQTLNTYNFTDYAGLDNQGNPTNFGNSMFDDKHTDIRDIQEGNTNELRAQNQGAGWKWAGVVPRIVGRAVTSAAELVGNVYGIGKYYTDLMTDPARKAEYLKEHGNLDNYEEPTWTTIINNGVTKWLDNADKYIKENIAPDYQSKNYQNAKWYEKIKYASFYTSDLADAVGFGLGATIDGATYEKTIGSIFKALNAGKVDELTNFINKADELKKAGQDTKPVIDQMNKYYRDIKWNNFTDKVLESTVLGTTESGQEARDNKELETNLINQITNNGQLPYTDNMKHYVQMMLNEYMGTRYLMNMVVCGPTNLLVFGSGIKKLAGFKEIEEDVNNTIKPELKNISKFGL